MISLTKNPVHRSYSGRLGKVNAADGAQSANTNIVFDLFDDKAAKGETKLTLANSDGKQEELYKADKSKVTSDTKAELRISIDPSIHTTKTGFAVALNHEGSVHGGGFLKALSVLRNKGGDEFFKEWKTAGTFQVGRETSATFPTKYLTLEFTHGQVGAGANTLYNRVNKEIRNQLSPTERKGYDAKVSANIKTYSAAADTYRKFIKK
jgi:hypothetical protein